MTFSAREESTFRGHDGATLACVRIGNGKPVLLAGGLLGGVGPWRHQIRHFDGRYAWHTWDYRGLGANGPSARNPRANRNFPAPETTVAEHALDAIALLDSRGIEQAAVVASSFGTQVALEIFRRAPSRVASLVLVGACAESPWRSRPLVERAVQKFLGLSDRALRTVEPGAKSVLRWPETRAWAKRLGWVGDTIDPESWHEAIDSITATDVASLRPFLRAMQEYDGAAILSRIDVPTLVVAVDRDFLTTRESAENIARVVRGAELMTVPGASHFVQAEFPELLSLRIEKFFRERGYAETRDSRRPSAPP